MKDKGIPLEVLQSYYKFSKEINSLIYWEKIGSNFYFFEESKKAKSYFSNSIFIWVFGSFLEPDSFLRKYLQLRGISGSKVFLQENKAIEINFDDKRKIKKFIGRGGSNLSFLKNVLKEVYNFEHPIRFSTK